MYPGTVPMRNCARPVIHRIQEFRPVLTARGGTGSRVPARDSRRAVPRCASRDFGPLLYDNSVPCISEIHSEFSDSIHSMQFHTEFQYDPAQDRRAEPGHSHLARVGGVCLRVPPWYFFPSMLVMSADYLPTPTSGSEGADHVPRYARYAPRTLISVLQSRSF